MYPTEKDVSLLLQEAQTLQKTAAPVLRHPRLDETLASFAPLPRESLFIGAAYDGLPLLLSLRDLKPGGILILGDEGAGKTAFLQMLAQAAARLFHPSALRFGVITPSPREWEDPASLPHCMGIFPSWERSAENYLFSLAEWIQTPQGNGQAVLLFLENLERMNREDLETQQTLRWILSNGARKRVIAFVTLRAARQIEVHAWLASFRTKIYGNIRQNPPSPLIQTLTPGMEFALREKSAWLRFWIPSP